MMKTIFLTLRVVGLVAIHFLCFIFLAAALLPRPADEPTVNASAAVVGVLLVSVLNTIVLSYIILRSTVARWNLILPLFAILYGVMTVLPQIETAFFVKLPSGMLARLFLFGAVFAMVFSLLAVSILGKKRPVANGDGSRSCLNMPAPKWLVKLFVIVILYLVVYFTFGYFIAWKSEAVRAYYGGHDPGSLWAQISSVIRDTPLLIPLQVVRALLWTAIAVVVIRIMKGHWWEAGLAVALLFSVMSAQLLIPNPLMPAEVRMVHLVETASSNLIFGWLVVTILCGWKT